MPGAAEITLDVVKKRATDASTATTAVLPQVRSEPNSSPPVPRRDIPTFPTVEQPGETGH